MNLITSMPREEFKEDKPIESVFNAVSNNNIEMTRTTLIPTVVAKTKDHMQTPTLIKENISPVCGICHEKASCVNNRCRCESGYYGDGVVSCKSRPTFTIDDSDILN